MSIRLPEGWQGRRDIRFPLAQVIAVLAEGIEQLFIVQVIESTTGICFSYHSHSNHQLARAHVRIEFQNFTEDG